VNRRPAVAALWAGVLLLVFDATFAAGVLARAPVVNDLRLGYLAARLVESRGWPALYDFHLQQAQAAALGLSWQPFVAPPPLVWLALPLSGLPFSAALVAWTLLLVAALAAAWRLATGGRGLSAAAQLVLGVALFPTAFGILVGQVPALVALAVVGSWWLAERGREVAAGVCLALLCLKPQTALLVPVALLFAGRLRLVASCAAALAAAASVSLLLLGTEGVRAYLAALGDASQWELTRRYAISEYATGPGLLLLQGAVVAVTGAAGLRARRRLETVYAAGVAGSLLFTPYAGIQDFTMLVAAAWLVLRRPLPAWHGALLGAGVLVAELVLVLGPLPSLLWRGAWLGVLALSTDPAQPRGVAADEQSPEHRLEQPVAGHEHDHERAQGKDAELERTAAPRHRDAGGEQRQV
jgi:Glycosyltransferase family 87